MLAVKYFTALKIETTSKTIGDTDTLFLMLLLRCSCDHGVAIEKPVISSSFRQHSHREHSGTPVHPKSLNKCTLHQHDISCEHILPISHHHLPLRVCPLGFAEIGVYRIIRILEMVSTGYMICIMELVRWREASGFTRDAII